MTLRYEIIGNIKLYLPKNNGLEKILPLIEPGSLDRLARLAIPVLNDKGLTFSSVEDSTATAGEIVSALTIAGSGRIINKSIIVSNMKQKFSRLFHQSGNSDQRSDIKMLTDIYLSKNSNKQNNVVLATLGDFDEGNKMVKIGLKIGKKYKFLTLTKNDYIKSVANMDIHQDNISSVQKQFVADQALRLMLKELKIDTSNILFEPQNENEVILNRSKNEIIKDLSKFLKGRKISTVESATGGYLAKTLSGIDNGKKLLSSGIVLYNTEEKMNAGILSEALAGDNLYGKSTAFALALIAKKRNKNDIAIGVTGLLDTEDTRLSYRFREPGVVYYSIIITGHEPITEKVHLPIKSRLEMKAGLTLIIFQRLLQVLIQDEMASL